MNFFPPPPGFQVWKLPQGFAWSRSGRKKPILAFWQKTGGHLRLSEAARRHSQSLRFAGRRAVTATPIPGAGTLVVRPCAHGGWWGRLAGDLYIGPERARREIRLSDHLIRMKIPTPRIETVVFYPAGPLVRLEVVTAWVPESQDLVRHLAARPGASLRARVFAAVRKLIRQLHHHGICHPDLNARNILLAPSSRGGFIAWLLDVDVVRLGVPGRSSVDQANRARLLRSLLKRARLGELGWSETEVAQLWRELFPRS